MRAITEQEFDIKYNLYKDMIFNIALNYTHNQDDSEDILQDVFMKYLNSSEEFKALENEKYWLIRVTINTSITFIKSKWKSGVTLDNEYISFVKDEDNSDKLRMRQIIFSLKDKYKDVIILYYYQNYNTKEIAEILKISQNSVKKRLERARDLIKKEY